MGTPQQIKQALKEQLRKGINSVQSYRVEELINRKIKVSIYDKTVNGELELEGISFGTLVGISCNIKDSYKDIKDMQEDSTKYNPNVTYYSIKLYTEGINIPGDINGYQKIHHIYREPVELGSSTTNFTNPWSLELYHIGSKYTGFIELLD